MANPHPVLSPSQQAWLRVVAEEAEHAAYASDRLAAAVQHGYHVHGLSLRQIAQAMGCSTRPIVRLRDLYVPTQVELDVLDLHSRDADRIVV